jgi:hypothetical protein
MAEFTRFGKLSSDEQTRKTVVTVLGTEAAVTYTAAQLLGGFIMRDCGGAHRADLLPLATLIVAAIDNCAIGDSIRFTIENTSDAAETITVTGVTGTSIVGTATIAQTYTKDFLAVVTAVATPTVVVYSLGTKVH